MVHSRLIFPLSLLLLAAACDLGPTTTVEEDRLQANWPVAPFPFRASVPGLSTRLTAKPGGTWSAPIELEVDLRRHRAQHGRFTHIIAAVSGEWRYDKEGSYRAGPSTYALSSNFTTAGVPIERFDGRPGFRLLGAKEGSPFEAVVSFPLPAEPGGRHTFSATLTAKLPADTPPGYYEPRLYVLARVEGVPDPVHLSRYGYGWNDWWFPALPLVKVGEAATPRIPWSILAGEKYMGRTGALPRSYRGKAALCTRSGFPARLILPPRGYGITPSFPSIFPSGTMAPIDGGHGVLPEELETYLRMDSGQASCRVSGPGGEQNLGTRTFTGAGEMGPSLQGGPFPVDMQRPGHYTITLQGTVQDAMGRTFSGGGTYDVYSARPLTFSTSCKPGCGFVVGDAYPPKVNVLPPFPAEVEMEVVFFPNSDPARKRTWKAKGRANRFGHYVTTDQPPLTFDEPGEYRSRVMARYKNSSGMLWMGEQVSTGVVAPRQPTLTLHGTRSFPYIRQTGAQTGAAARFENRPRIPYAVMLQTPYVFQDPFAPYYPQDTLFVPANFSDENLIEPHFSVGVHDDELRRRLVAHHTRRSVMPPVWSQPLHKPWSYLKDVLQISSVSYAWFPADAKETADELPIAPVGQDGWHPSAFPGKKKIEAYTTMGVVRPGFPVMTAAFAPEGLGLYWLASPNRFGGHFNRGNNGDLPGDLYRIQAGVVLRDLERKQNHYDVYGASIVVVPADGPADSNSILAPGKRPLITVGAREHRIFLATDTHDVVEVGEAIGLGGMVFPNIPAKVTWTVTRPSGEVSVARLTASKLGTGRGQPPVIADEPGLYRVKVDVQHGDLRGDVVGTPRGVFWHAAVAPDQPPLLSSSVPGIQRIDAVKGIRVPVSWPARLKKVKLHFGVLMPGQVLDQGEVEPADNSWAYPFAPLQVARQYPNLDVRDFSTGKWALADTVVFQFLLEAEDDGQRVVDSLRLFLRRDMLYNYRELMTQ